MIAEILCVGTELLMGQVLNTNAQFLSRRLSALGISQYHQTVVGDNAQRLEEAYRLALSRADVVITSGGLGPTVDDITKRVAAKVAGKELVLFPEAEAMVRGDKLSSGMIPKLSSCVRALDSGVSAAHIINGTVPHALLLELLTDSGMGTMVGGLASAQFLNVSPVSKFAAKLIENGLLVLTAGQNVIRLLPPLTISREEIDKGLAIMKTVLCNP